jgi:hypothetical protein
MIAQICDFSQKSQIFAPFPRYQAFLVTKLQLGNG